MPATTIPTVTIYHHKERSWADYLIEYSCVGELRDKRLVTIKIASLPQQNSHLSFAQLPERLRRLLFFAKPDIVISLDDGIHPVRPVFAIDVTEHVAARDHWIQRFPNLVGCAQEGVPGAFIAPRNMPNRPGFAGHTDPFFFFAYDRVVEIHNCPIYIADWPSGDGANLDMDSSFGDLPPHDSAGVQKVFAFFRLALDASLHGRDVATLTRERLIIDLRNEIRCYAYKTIPQIRDFERLAVSMPENRPLTRREFDGWLTKLRQRLPGNLPDRIGKRDRFVIFAPTVKRTDRERVNLLDRIKRKGGDPYTQQPLVFDYLFCRIGPTPAERDTNLVIDLSIMSFSDFASYIETAWKESPLQFTNFARIRDDVPRYTLHLNSGIAQVVKNFVRLYTYAADLIVFRDGVLYF